MRVEPTENVPLARIAELVTEGRRLAARGDARGAEARFREAIDEVDGLPTEDVEAYIWKAHALNALGRADAAIQALDMATRADTRSEAARFYLAEALVRAGDLKRAAMQLHYVLKLCPTYAPGLALRGEITRRSGNVAQAARDFALANSLAPGDPRVLARLGDAFAALGDTAQALGAYDEALRLDPTCWIAYAGAAPLLETPADAREARACYRVLATRPGWAEQAAAGLARAEALIQAQGLPAHGPAAAPRPRLATFTPPALPTRPEPKKSEQQATQPLGTSSAPLRVKLAPLPGRPATGPVKPPPGTTVGRLALPPVAATTGDLNEALEALRGLLIDPGAS